MNAYVHFGLHCKIAGSNFTAHLFQQPLQLMDMRPLGIFNNSQNNNIINV
jgi:hypothetical protein